MTREQGRKWTKGILLVAGFQSFIGGAFALLFPTLALEITGQQQGFHVMSFQWSGAVMMTFGFGYLIASYDAYRYWPIVMIGLMYQLLVPLVFFIDILTGMAHTHINNIIIFNYLIWIVPFALILRKVYRESYDTDALLLDMFGANKYPLNLFKTSQGDNLEELTTRQPVMVVFLRHFGCTFCRETLQDLAKEKDAIHNMGVKLVIAHMVDDERAREVMQCYGLGQVATLSDPECILYKRFNLSKARLPQLFGPKAIWRGLIAGILKGNGLGTEEGDAFQMPGVFLLENGEVVNKYIHKSAADRPNYTAIAHSPNGRPNFMQA